MKVSFLAFAAVASTGLGLHAQEPKAPSDRETEARALLESFDEAWAQRDLEGLMAPLSPFFGCELYGDVNAGQLRDVFGMLLDDLRGTRATTHVLQVHEEGAYLQAFACRKFTPLEGPAGPVEEQCHVYYLKAEDDGLAVVGLEEYDHDGFACLTPERFEQPRLAFSFDRPEGYFAVPVPDGGTALEEVVLRGDGLRTELRLVLLACEEPFDLEAAFDEDLETWLGENRPAKVERRRRGEVAGLPAWQATIRYSGRGCQLGGGGPHDEPKRARRVYVALGKRHLLAFTLHAPRARFDAAAAALDRLLESFQLDLDEGLSYAETIERRNGWGRIDGGTYLCSDSGLMVEVPEGFELELTRSGPLLSLRAAPERGGVAFRIDCIPLLDPAVPLEELIELDDTCRETVRRSEIARRVGEHSAVQVDRELPSSHRESRLEKIVYMRSGRHVVTIRVAGTPDEVEGAEPALEQLLKGITILGKK